ncbi:hypothetical protein QE369_000338 [Agrobacterium larrymoorei]|uniref:Uncharacterized protein n=1 Tax=Agrobacterium larrymoorei TaxID=160699 RepID=A0AAJ2BIC2_9HYPH|nr:hypothetical protein [Agrobacterium larrymoorei]MDR6100160.1 hypothetical protein [Agrobacterium larrymoorei]
MSKDSGVINATGRQSTAFAVRLVEIPASRAIDHYDKATGAQTGLPPRIKRLLLQLRNQRPDHEFDMLFRRSTYLFKDLHRRPFRAKAI